MSADLKVLMGDLTSDQLREFFQNSVKPGSIDPKALANALLSLNQEQYRVFPVLRMFIRQNRYTLEDIECLARVVLNVTRQANRDVDLAFKKRVSKTDKERAFKAAILTRNIAAFVREAILEPVRLELR